MAYAPSGTHEPPPLCSSLLQHIANPDSKVGVTMEFRLVNFSNLVFPVDTLHISGSLKHTTTTLDNLTAATAPTCHENENYLKHDD